MKVKRILDQAVRKEHRKVLLFYCHRMNLACIIFILWPRQDCTSHI